MKLLNKIVEHGLYAIVFFLPWQTRLIVRSGELNNGYWEYGTIALYGVDIIILAVLFLFIISKVFPSLKMHLTPPAGVPLLIRRGTERGVVRLWVAIALFELAVFISIFQAPDKILAFYSYLKILLGISLFWMMMEASYDRAKLIFIFLLAIFLQAVLGIGQFLSQTSFSFKWLGMALHNPAELGTSVIEAGGAGRWLRAYGSLDHPNILGGVLAIAILFTLTEILKSRETKILWRSYITWYYFFLPIFSLALFFTFSRSAWLGVIVGIIIMLAAAFKQKNFSAQKKFLEIILVLGIFVFILSNIFSGLVNARLDADTRLEIKSNTERIKSYQAAWSLIKNHWLLGVGVGNYTLAEFNLDPTQPSYYYQPTHNTFFLIISEIGLLGFLFFILIILLLFQGGARGGLSKNKNFFSFVILVAILVMSMFDHWWWSLHFGILFFGMMMGLTRIKWHAGLALD